MENQVYTNNNGQEFIITDNFLVKSSTSSKIYKKVIVKFLATNHTKEAYLDNVLAGKVRDEFHRSVLGVGYLGSTAHKQPYWKQAKELWRNMMKRCYNPKDPRGYYGDVVVDPRWHDFSRFSDDLKELPNFQSWLDSSKTGEKWNLDKDFRGDGSVYGFEVCQFLTEHENKSAGAKTRVLTYKQNKGLVQK